MFERHTERNHRCDECNEWAPETWVKALLEFQIQFKEDVMADLAALNAAVDALVAEEGSVKSALDDLAAKVAAGSGVTQADIDAVTAKLTGVSADLKTAVEKDDPAPAPAPEPVPAPPVVTPAPAEQGGGVVTGETTPPAGGAV